MRIDLYNIVTEREYYKINHDDLIDDDIYQTAQDYIYILDGIINRQKIHEDRTIKKIGEKTNLPHDMENVIGDYLGSSKYNTKPKKSKKGGKKSKRKTHTKGKKHNKKSRKSIKSRKPRR